VATPRPAAIPAALIGSDRDQREALRCLLEADGRSTVVAAEPLDPAYGTFDRDAAPRARRGQPCLRRAAGPACSAGTATGRAARANRGAQPAGGPHGRCDADTTRRARLPRAGRGARPACVRRARADRRDRLLHPRPVGGRGDPPRGHRFHTAASRSATVARTLRAQRDDAAPHCRWRRLRGDRHAACAQSAHRAPDGGTPRYWLGIMVDEENGFWNSVDD